MMQQFETAVKLMFIDYETVLYYTDFKSTLVSFYFATM